MVNPFAHNKHRPIVVITGVTGRVGTILKESLKESYCVVGMARPGSTCDIEMDVTSRQSVDLAFKRLRDDYGNGIAAVIHLAAYFDFSGQDSPLYDQVNCDGTRYLLQTLQAFNVQRFIYTSTMLVHKPGDVGETIDEDSPLDPQWPYPNSKTKTEAVIRREHGKVPYLIMRLAALYDEDVYAPTLAHQVARIYEHNLKSVFYAGDRRAGQAFIHREDMLRLFDQVIKSRDHLPEEVIILAGEPDTASYEKLQKTIGELIHGVNQWKTISLPKPVAKAGAWLQEKSEPLIPDDIDQGEKPFVKPFMIDMASDHYALDISKARRLLNWQPGHRLMDSLPLIIEKLKNDPIAWYENNRITPPAWVQGAAQKYEKPENIRRQYEDQFLQEHQHSLWAQFLNIGLGFWLLTSPWTFGYESQALILSDVIAGLAIIIFGTAALSARPILRNARWLVGGVGLWLLFAPLLFWAPTASAYLNDTLLGTLIIGFALLVRPLPGMSPLAATTGPDIPPGWDFSPSSWVQRLPIILLAFIGFYISRYLTAYQLQHINGIWEPFFHGALPDAKNATEEIITSPVSKAWPVPDAGIGAVTYLLEILTGIIGSSKRWRTMPWLVLLFGFMIVPLGAISITFIIIQPIILGTWCTLCLIAAAAMLLQIPYSFDEIVATLSFLKRRSKAGRPWLVILFTGDTDESANNEQAIEHKMAHGEDNFARSSSAIFRDMINGGISVPWHLGVCAVIGIWLLFTRLTIGSTGTLANAEHLIGSLTITFTIAAFSEVVRPLRFLNFFLGLALLIIPFIFTSSILSILSSVVCGLGLITFSIPRGPISSHYGDWNRYII